MVPSRLYGVNWHPTLFIFTEYVSFLLYRRTMAGGHPAKMAIKKNMYLEEWNGKREITERTFEINGIDIPRLVFFVMIVPFGIYSWSRSELINAQRDHRYKEVF